MSDWPWVAASYALTWIVLGTYALRVHRRIGEARAELERTTRRSEGPVEMER